jgi:hypothetical protein
MSFKTCPSLRTLGRRKVFRGYGVSSLRSVSGAIRHDTLRVRVNAALPNCFRYWDLKGAARDAPCMGFQRSPRSL